MTHSRKWLANELAAVAEANCWQKLLSTISVPGSYSRGSSTLSFLREEVEGTTGEVCWGSKGFWNAVPEDETPDESLSVDARLLVSPPSVANGAPDVVDARTVLLEEAFPMTVSKVLWVLLNPAAGKGGGWCRLGECDETFSARLLGSDGSSEGTSTPFCWRWEISRTQ